MNEAFTIENLVSNHVFLRVIGLDSLTHFISICYIPTYEDLAVQHAILADEVAKVPKYIHT